MLKLSNHISRGDEYSQFGIDVIDFAYCVQRFIAYVTLFLSIASSIIPPCNTFLPNPFISM
ncbi:hypothetical protein HZF08_01585 [Paenibacillus sp. CGMCC 1.16610]|nr:hypothetical protein [Paenibacillus sp. CGMCC 1.16610]